MAIQSPSWKRIANERREEAQQAWNAYAGIQNRFLDPEGNHVQWRNPGDKETWMSKYFEDKGWEPYQNYKKPNYAQWGNQGRGMEAPSENIWTALAERISNPYFQANIGSAVPGMGTPTNTAQSQWGGNAPNFGSYAAQLVGGQQGLGGFNQAFTNRGYWNPRQ